MAQQAAPEADQAQLTGPVVGATAIPRLYKYDLAAQGYVAEEFFLSGSATSYALDNGAGTKSERRIHEAIQAPFVTRLVVIRPTDPGRFNGTAVVEWLNVSGGTDAAPEWLYLHRHIMRQGMAWIGVSAQWVGVEGTTEGIFGVGIKTADPERYGSLLHPGDAFSYDIFTHAGSSRSIWFSQSTWSACCQATDRRGPITVCDVYGHVRQLGRPHRGLVRRLPCARTGRTRCRPVRTRRWHSECCLGRVELLGAGSGATSFTRRANSRLPCPGHYGADRE